MEERTEADLLEHWVPGGFEDAQAHPGLIVAWHLAKPAYVAFHGPQLSVGHYQGPQASTTLCSSSVVCLEQGTINECGQHLIMLF